MSKAFFFMFLLAAMVVESPGIDKIITGIIAGVGIIGIPIGLVAWIITKAFPAMQIAEQKRWEQRELSVEARLKEMHSSYKDIVSNVTISNREIIKEIVNSNKETIKQIMDAHAEREAIRDEVIKSLTNAVRGLYDVMMPISSVAQRAIDEGERAHPKKLPGQR